MKVPAIKSVPPLGLYGSSTFTIDHSLCSSGRHGKSISIHSFPSCFYRPLPSLSGLYQWARVQYAYTIYMHDFTAPSMISICHLFDAFVLNAKINRKIKTQLQNLEFNLNLNSISINYVNIIYRDIHYTSTYV